MSLLNVGARALMANQTVLQTTGNNIANVNTPGYSRQTVQLQTVESQYSGSGYIGKGVNVATITRSYSEFLTRQAALAGATSAGDTTRAEKLKQLESLFPAGTMGIGAAVSDMLNAFSDVATAPTDLTARTVALTKTDETAKRLSNTSTLLDDLQQGVKLELDQKTTAINTLATSIAAVNDKIARATGNGQPPNDLLDQRDQLVRELNQYVQTSSVQATDGTTSVFIGGSQALVMGITASTVALSQDEFGDPNKTKLTLTRAGATITMNEDLLGGGEVSGLLRFQNGDMNEARNLLGRYTLALSTSLNDQHKLGLDLDGNTGGNLFTPATLGNLNIWPDSSNTGAATLGLSITDASQFAASDYEINFTGAAAGTVTRRSDGVVTAFSAVPIVVDGLSISVTAGALNGDRFLIKPFSTAASTIATEFSTPRALAVASPVAGMMGSSNTGSLQLSALTARTNPSTNVPVTIKFTGANTYTRSDTGITSYTYTSGQAIEGSVPATTPLSQWSLTLQGTPNAGDTFTVEAQPAAYRNLNSGNASAMMNVRDLPMFDGAAVTDGYASLIAQIGIRAMSADYSANVSNAIALTAEKERTGVSGVNLDEEASKLLQYQQAYQASAKMIQVASSIFDTLIQTLGR